MTKTGNRVRNGLYRFVITMVFIGMFLVVAGIAIVIFWVTLRQTENNYTLATILASLVVIALGIIIEALYEAYRRWSIERPANHILYALERISRGDFSYRMELVHEWGAYDEFDQIKAYVNQMAEELSKHESQRSDAIADISHEIRTPIAVIAANVQLLEDPNIAQEARQQSMRVIVDACEGLANMIANILKLNRLENQKILPKHEFFDLSESLSQLILQLSDRIDAKGIELVCDIPEQTLIKSDRELLNIIWNNLLSNAIKFTDSGGKITISLKREGDEIAVAVSDTGCGIAPEAGQKIFEKFYQGDTSHKAEGNGLGLSLVKRVLEIVGGSIAIHSRVGEGTTFTVTLRAE